MATKADKEANTPEAQPHQVELAETAHKAVLKEAHKEALDTDLAHQAVHHPEAHPAEVKEAMDLHKEPHKDQAVTDQLLLQKLLQLAAHVTKDHQDQQVQRVQLETQARTETTERMETMERTPNCWLPNQPKSALSAHKDHKDHPDLLDQKDHQDQKDPQVKHQRMANPETKESKANQVHKDAQDVKDHVEPQDKTVVLSQFQDHKDHPAHPDNKENQVKRVNQVQMDNHSKDHLDCPETLVPLAAKDVQDQPVPLDQAEMLERKALANTAQLLVLHQAINCPVKQLRSETISVYFVVFCLSLSKTIQNKSFSLLQNYPNFPSNLM